MIDKKDYVARFTSYLKHINGDGQTIKNILDVFNDMQKEIEEIKEEMSKRDAKFYERIREIEKEFEEKTEHEASVKYNSRVGYLRRQIAQGIRRYIDEEFSTQ